MRTLRDSVKHYIAWRQGQGFSMRTSRYTLLRFAAFLEEHDRPYITVDATTQWLQEQSAKAKPAIVAGYMDAIRVFAQYRIQEDPRTEVPPYGVFAHPPRFTQPRSPKKGFRPTKHESKTSPLRQAVVEYLEMRRGLGFKLRLAGAGLLDFVSFLDDRGADYITISLALEWAQQPASGKPATWAQRLGFVRDFARHRIAIDPRTEIPLWDHLPHSKKRTQPYLYSDTEIEELLTAALQLPIYSWPAILRRQTYHCMFGLLAVTGMRIGEAVALKVQDVELDSGVLTIERSKSGQSRLIPVHPSTKQVLANFKIFRDQFLEKLGCTSEYLFCTQTGHQLDTGDARRVFYILSRMVGLRKGEQNRGPRIHDLRHYPEFRIIRSKLSAVPQTCPRCGMLVMNRPIYSA